MFGYVRPSDDRLTPADRETFRAAYCGLCHALGARYGLVGRMILNYDLTFLAMVLSDGAGEMCAKRCAVHPIRRRCCVAGDPALDAAADAFAKLLALAAEEVSDPVRRRVTAQLLYHLGRWVYLVDAADDLRADIKSGGYNPLALRFTPKDGALAPADSEALALTLDGSVRAMAAAFELLPETKYTPVLRAAVYEGLYAVGAAVLHGTFRKRQRREEPIRKADTDYA